MDSSRSCRERTFARGLLDGVECGAGRGRYFGVVEEHDPTIGRERGSQPWVVLVEIFDEVLKKTSGTPLFGTQASRGERAAFTSRNGT
jgi:hypothetical protein